jgi:ATP-dependent DNA helicase RecQ
LPERETVGAVYDACRKLADADGLVDADAATIAATAKGKVSDREADSAICILMRGGALAVADASRTHAHVRLLATTDRIKAELGDAAHGMELELLRSLWRRAGAAFHLGIVADLAAMPPGLGGAMGAANLLDALQARQFVVWRRLGEGMTVTDPERDVNAWPIDWAALDRRRQGELRKLEMVQKYAYTNQCRRAFVLRYFGDPAARPKCDGCDNCLGIKHEARVGDPAARNGAGRRAGRNGSSRNGAARDSSKTTTAGPTAAPLSAAEQTRMESLRALRSTLAKDEEVPAYVIFPDRTLREMAREQPRTMADLGRIHGVGPTRLERFGKQFLEVLSSQPSGSGPESPA